MAGRQRQVVKPVAAPELGLEISPATMRYIDMLVRVGTHGATVREVLMTFVLSGVRDAIEKGFISKLDQRLP